MSLYKDRPEFYDAIYGGSEIGAQISLDFLNWVFGYCGIKKGNNNKKLLDMGAGTGRLLIPLTELEYNIEGMEPFQEMIDIALNKANKKRVNIRLSKGAFESLSLEDEYDLIFAMNGTMAYMYDSKTFISSFQNIATALKPGGFFLLDLMNFLGLIKSYKSPESQKLEILGERLTFIHDHEIDLENSIWHHTSSIFIEGKDNRITKYVDIQKLAMVTPRELIYYAKQAGLTCVEQLKSYEDRPNDRKNGLRIILLFKN